jgi:hypothetical protein
VASAIDEVVQYRGTQFDEAVVDAFLVVMREEAMVPAPAITSPGRKPVEAHA